MHSPRAPLGPLIALSSSLSIGALLVVAPLLWRVIPPTELPPPFAHHHQDAETLIFLLAFVVFLPLGIVISIRVSDRVAAGPNTRALSAVAALLSAALGLAVVVTRASAALSWGGGPAVLAATGALWCGLAAVTLWRTASSVPSGLLSRTADRSAWIWASTGLLLGPVVLSFTDIRTISVPTLLAGAGMAAVVLSVHQRIHPAVRSGWRGGAVDGAIVVLLLLAIPNIAIFSSGGSTAAYDALLLQFHQNFYLGPANQILAGDAMLVDVLSQYGVGSIYFVAGVFMVVPIGGLLHHGAMRFGLPAGVVLGAVAEARWPQAATWARGLQLLTVAIASIWALEAFAYTLLTAGAVIGMGVAMLPAGQRGRTLARRTAQVAAAGVAAHLVLAAATRTATGELPDWGWYVNTLREFFFGGIGDFTYDFTSFSPGYLVGALYLLSASALVLIVVRRPELLEVERTIIIAIAGWTAGGVALLSYLVNRSTDLVIPYVSLPAVALGALWLDLFRRPGPGVPLAGRRAILGAALALSTLLGAVAWPSMQTRMPESALAHAVPGGPSLTAALERLRTSPPLRSEALTGEHLLDQHPPGERRSIVLTQADLAVEILMRSQRGSRVPLGDPWRDSFVPDRHLAALGAFVDGLVAGDRALLDPAGHAVFDDHVANRH